MAGTHERPEKQVGFWLSDVGSRGPRHVWLWRGGLVVALLLACAGQAAAGPPVAWLGGYLPSVVSRSNVVRICIVIAAIALFIMLKKLDASEDKGGLRP